jgi:hypothetical protein
MAGSREDVMSVASVSDPRLASKVGTRTWGTILAQGHPTQQRDCVKHPAQYVFCSVYPYRVI